jgi:hypothetical protein
LSDDLVTAVLHRASIDESLSEGSQLLVLAALEGGDVLGDALESPRPALAVTASGRDSAGSPVRAFLSSVTVEGFRGIGPASKLTLTPAPGLVVVAGRNGCGKSSFAEALEMTLTRGSYRWRQRTAVWHQAWRNVHHQSPVSITVTLAEEGHGPTVVGAQWEAGAPLEGGAAWTQRRGAKREPGLDVLGWASRYGDVSALLVLRRTRCAVRRAEQVA